MNKLKQLQEKREALIREMDKAKEARDFKLFNQKDGELVQLQEEIEAEERMLKLAANKDPIIEPKKTTSQEIRAALAKNEEFDITGLEVRNTHVMGAATGTNTSVGNLGKETYATSILKKLPYISPLYNATRKEMLGSAIHSIPVQKTKLGKFVRMTELQQYANQNADYNTVKLEPTKYGTMVSISEEALADTGYDLEADLLEQITESYGLTLDELIVTGDATTQGLNSFTVADDAAVQVTQPVAGQLTVDDIMDIYYALPKRYRNMATWIFNDATAKQISKLRTNDGYPLFIENYKSSPLDNDGMILGRPVIINDNVAGIDAAAGAKSIFFTDLTKSLVVGPRQSVTIKRSDEVGFLNDSIAIKASVRLDIKKTLGEALVMYVTA